jgi:hypothetical protein
MAAHRRSDRRRGHLPILTHAITKPTRPMTNKILPSWGETPDIQRAIPIAMKANPHRWTFFIVPSFALPI